MNGEGQRILIVDDARNVADTTAMIFAHAGYQVKTAYSAEESIELIREWSPSAAILDVLLPRMNGIELAKLIQKNCPKCRILLFSTQSFSGGPTPVVSNEFDFLVKPISPTELLSVVEASLRNHRAA